MINNTNTFSSENITGISPIFLQAILNSSNSLDCKTKISRKKIQSQKITENNNDSINNNTAVNDDTNGNACDNKTNYHLTEISDTSINFVNILPSAISDEESEDIASEHDAQPIKSVEDILRIQNYFLTIKNPKIRYRNYLLFTLGINTGLRCSDIICLKFNKFINEDGTFKDDLVVLEQKTKNTRGRKYFTDENNNYILDEYGNKTYTCKKKNRHIKVNDAVKQAISLYLENIPNIKLDDYMFTSASNNKSAHSNNHLYRSSVQDILTDACTALNINLRTGTHMLRKTFSYHIIMNTPQNDRSRAIEILQNILGHSSPSTTARYAGITNDEKEVIYDNLNLGLKAD